MQWYRTGSVNVINGSTLITGDGTLWLLQVKVGDILTLNASDLYEVASIDANTAITLATPYLGVTENTQPYAILRNFTSTTNAELAVKIATLLNSWQVRENEFSNWQGGTATGGAAADGIYPLTDALGNVVNAKSIARIQQDVGAVITSTLAPTTAQILAGSSAVWKNSTDGSLKLYANDGGTLKSITFL